MRKGSSLLKMTRPGTCDGPSVGVHVWAWCDSVNTVTRWFSRDMQGHFKQRIGFAMNATDSSQLLDSPVASRLGPNRAWLFRGDRGLLKKFRPYHPPTT
jgi:S-DNA-T family DNA segregation ATPase FtsK/SpoIIIE